MHGNTRQDRGLKKMEGGMARGTGGNLYCSHTATVRHDPQVYVRPAGGDPRLTATTAGEEWRHHWTRNTRGRWEEERDNNNSNRIFTKEISQCLITECCSEVPLTAGAGRSHCRGEDGKTCSSGQHDSWGWGRTPQTSQQLITIDQLSLEIPTMMGRKTPRVASGTSSEEVTPCTGERTHPCRTIASVQGPCRRALRSPANACWWPLVVVCFLMLLPTTLGLPAVIRIGKCSTGSVVFHSPYRTTLLIIVFQIV